MHRFNFNVDSNCFIQYDIKDTQKMDNVNHRQILY